MAKGGTTLLDPQKILSRLDIRDGDTIADLGCGGGGHFVGSLARMVGSKGKVFALDIQRDVLKSVEAKMRLQNIENVITVWSDLEKVGGAKQVKDGICDQVIIINVLFQNKNHKEILQEAARMLKSGGTLAVIDWKTTGSPFGPPTELRVEPDTLKEVAKNIGLHTREEFDAGTYHYALVFSK